MRNQGVRTHSKSYAIKNQGRKPEKPAWKQVGFFMIVFDSSCQ
jgi:hypothetical protein